MKSPATLTTLLIALAVAGCGSSSGSTTQGLGAPTSSAASTSAAATSAASSPAASTAASVGGSATASTAPSSAPSLSAAGSAVASLPPAKGVGSGGDRQFCQAISLNLKVLTSAAGDGTDPTIQQGLARLRQLQAIAPAEIRGNLKVIADFDQKIVDALRGGKAPDIAETPELTAALTSQARWGEAHCT